jgi:hypothetical protein
MTTKEIKKANPEGKFTCYSGKNCIVFDNGVQLPYQNAKEKNKIWNKLLKMGYHRHINLNSDEMDGLAEAGRRGENPFAYSLISANTTLNGIFK